MKTLPFVIALTLVGCGTAETFRNTSTMELCSKYLTMPTFNIWHSARASELQRRGENCGGYVAQAAVQQQASQQLLDAAVILSAPPPRPTAQTCRWVGPNWVCS